MTINNNANNSTLLKDFTRQDQRNVQDKKTRLHLKSTVMNIIYTQTYIIVSHIIIMIYEAQKAQRMRIVNNKTLILIHIN